MTTISEFFIIADMVDDRSDVIEDTSDILDIVGDVFDSKEGRTDGTELKFLMGNESFETLRIIAQSITEAIKRLFQILGNITRALVHIFKKLLDFDKRSISYSRKRSVKLLKWLGNNGVKGQTWLDKEIPDLSIRQMVGYSEFTKIEESYQQVCRILTSDVANQIKKLTNDMDKDERVSDTIGWVTPNLADHLSNIGIVVDLKTYKTSYTSPFSKRSESSMSALGYTGLSKVTEIITKFDEKCWTPYESLKDSLNLMETLSRALKAKEQTIKRSGNIHKNVLVTNIRLIQKQVTLYYSLVRNLRQAVLTTNFRRLRLIDTLLVATHRFKIIK